MSNSITPREIKFRVWDNKDKYWYDDDVSIRSNGTVFETDADGYRDYLGNVTVMQCIGVTANDKDIYEGDILKVKNEWGEQSLHAVKWCAEHDYPAFDLEPSVSDELNSIAEVICGDYEYEIIGNIYEDPSLLGASDE